MLAGDEQQQFEFLPACTPLHCTLGLTTHARHAALARDSDCLGLGRTLDTLLVCAWNPGCGLAGPSSKLTSSPSFPSLPSLPSPHTSQVHTHGIRAAGDPSSATGAPVSKRRLSKHHRSCPPIRVWYQSMASAPTVAQQWWRAGGDAAHPGQVRLLEFLLSIIILMILMILIIITAPFTPSCCVRRYAWLAPCRPNATRSRHAGPHSHLRSERASEE